MPFHRFYCPSGLYSKEEKQAIAKEITDLYSKIPAFYVVVNFIEVDKDSYFVSGAATDRFLRIDVQHLAKHFQSVEEKRAWMDRYEKAIEPYTKGKGIDWEVQISNEDSVFWNQNGIWPPPFESDAFNRWKEVNKPVEYLDARVRCSHRNT